MLDSKGHAVSALERLLEIKKPARSFWEKYCCWCKKQ